MLGGRFGSDLRSCRTLCVCVCCRACVCVRVFDGPFLVPFVRPLLCVSYRRHRNCSVVVILQLCLMSSVLLAVDGVGVLDHSRSFFGPSHVRGSIGSSVLNLCSRRAPSVVHCVGPSKLLSTALSSVPAEAGDRGTVWSLGGGRYVDRNVVLEALQQRGVDPGCLPMWHACKPTPQ